MQYHRNTVAIIREKTFQSWDSPFLWHTYRVGLAAEFSIWNMSPTVDKVMLTTQPMHLLLTAGCNVSPGFSWKKFQVFFLILGSFITALRHTTRLFWCQLLLISTDNTAKEGLDGRPRIFIIHVLMGTVPDHLCCCAWNHIKYNILLYRFFFDRLEQYILFNTNSKRGGKCRSKET